VSLAATYTTCTPQPLHSEYYPWLYNSTVWETSKRNAQLNGVCPNMFQTVR
jgi:hypothetical protein